MRGASDLMDFLLPWYPWLKVGHLFADFAWMAGIFYLPRLYVYHCQVAVGSDQSELFKKMERLLLRAIMNPAMVAAWVFGTLLALTPGVVDFGLGWFYLKALGFLGITLFHHHLGLARKSFERDERRHSERYWRLMNEAPTLLLLLIIVMVIVKPF